MIRTGHSALSLPSFQDYGHRDPDSSAKEPWSSSERSRNSGGQPSRPDDDWLSTEQWRDMDDRHLLDRVMQSNAVKDLFNELGTSESPGQGRGGSSDRQKRTHWGPDQADQADQDWRMGKSRDADRVRIQELEEELRRERKRREEAEADAQQQRERRREAEEALRKEREAEVERRRKEVEEQRALEMKRLQEREKERQDWEEKLALEVEKVKKEQRQLVASKRLKEAMEARKREVDARKAGDTDFRNEAYQGYKREDKSSFSRDGDRRDRSRGSDYYDPFDDTRTISYDRDSSETTRSSHSGTQLTSSQGQSQVCQFHPLLDYSVPHFFASHLKLLFLVCYYCPFGYEAISYAQD